ncbi:DUF305 domain-containing protein [Mycolicibacterium duvalii]|uniref:DUF305 domain-containing protein n=2 Tax=Mycolicibacterium duvalii TaxID=39688 RepID=A0A7I7K7G3_9MYCO|nr:DUF305 domain-containing protein [Mycolicibacterium duvalii]
MAAAAMVAALTACGNSADNEGSPPAPETVQTSSDDAAVAHNQADMMFARHMIPHHEQAIQISDIVLAKQGIDPRVIDLANQIKAAQGPEIAQMQGWLDQWGPHDMEGMPGDTPHHGGMDHGGMDDGGPMMPGMAGMAGMLSPEDIQALEAAQGVEASRLFLTQMIAHHEGAITMAQDEIDNGEFPEAVTLAESIIASQQQEIDTMNQVLSSL